MTEANIIGWIGIIVMSVVAIGGLIKYAIIEPALKDNAFSKELQTAMANIQAFNDNVNILAANLQASNDRIANHETRIVLLEKEQSTTWHRIDEMRDYVTKS